MVERGAILFIPRELEISNRRDGVSEELCRKRESAVGTADFLPTPSPARSLGSDRAPKGTDLAAAGKNRSVYPYWERATSSSVFTVNNGRKSRPNDRRAMRYRICP